MNIFSRIAWRIRVRLFRGHLLICDDRGTTRWPSNSKTWCIGGYTIPYWNVSKVVRSWNEIKRNLISDPSKELKWSHFFEGPHQEKFDNPLLSNDPSSWREQAKWVLEQLTKIQGLVPMNTLVRKDKASDALFIDYWDKTWEKDYRVLDVGTLWVPILGSLALYLRQIGSLAEVWFDRMGSRAEEERRQESWLEMRNGVWKVKPENQRLLKAISPEMRFFDSSTTGLVQVADVISGVIWAASEEDEDFLTLVLDRYFPLGTPSYTLVNLE
jgi:hypothetical protein